MTRKPTKRVPESAAELRRLADSGIGSPWRRILGWAVGLLALAALLVVVFRIGEVEQFLRLAREARPIWLVPALAAQTVTYVLAAAVWWAALRRAGHAQRLTSLVPLGVAKLFTDQAIPSSGLSGSLMVAIGLNRRRVPAPMAIGILLLGLVSYNLAYFACVLASLVFLGLRHELDAAILAAAAVFCAIAIATPMSVLWLKRWSANSDNHWLRRFRGVSVILEAVAQAPTHLLRSPTLVAGTVALQLGIFLLDVLTLWLVFHAIGMAVDFPVVFASFVLAEVAATVGPMPLGLGEFEAASVAMLVWLGVPLEAALTATMLLRGLTFWLPMLPGLWLARRELERPGPVPKA
jgi:uncharacterized protein (TIRG00374 family)